ncbi:cobalamin-dependent protein [Actinophytocola xanthii]|uniref:B12-binding domain-containing protein n=1 Tax=Actinophytocola xanthii TaxID=1912961 RepID=A0A1Q8CJZ4_9PSEU|nr:cobalamin-dependent protein [Actinophytocola xanthii]OLF14680.1 hypothetical protein BU204_25655 [Actinophytocola xanthii]
MLTPLHNGWFRQPEARHVLLTTVASDAHTWNLVYLELLLVELGREVTNLGPCVPVSTVVESCRRRPPALLVVSTVNGHGAADGLELVRSLYRDPATRAVPAVIGGKLGIGGAAGECRRDLLAAGYRAVYEDTDPETPYEFLARALDTAAGPAGHVRDSA